MVSEQEIKIRSRIKGFVKQYAKDVRFMNNAVIILYKEFVNDMNYYQFNVVNKRMLQVDTYFGRQVFATTDKQTYDSVINGILNYGVERWKENLGISKKKI
jgi:hypothetical protein